MCRAALRCTAALAVGLMLASCTAAGDARPNVVLISIDSLRADHVGALGYTRETTPSIDRLAGGGALFSSALSSTSWTLPAHAALLTGLSDSAHGATGVRSRLSDGAFTLAEALRDAGYHTAGFFSGPFLEPGFGLDQGFARYVDCTSYGAGQSDLSRAKLHAASHRDRTNPIVLWQVLHELDRAGDRPFFFFIHLWDVHYDLIPPPPFDTMFDADYEGGFDGGRFRHNPGFRPGMEPVDLAHTLALYDGEIRYTDETIGMILARLEALGELDDTLVVVTSDHGDEFLDHDDKGHRHSLYQELIRVPLLFRLPGRVPVTRIEDPVSLIDVAPTILELTGAPPLPAAMGRSLLPLIGGDRSAEPVPVLSELTAPPRAPSMSSLVVGHEKVIVDHDRGGALYFDLASDPGEQAPTPAAESKAGRQLLAQLRQRREMAAARRPSSGQTRRDLGGRLRSLLSALGYLE